MPLGPKIQRRLKDTEALVTSCVPFIQLSAFDLSYQFS